MKKFISILTTVLITVAMMAQNVWTLPDGTRQAAGKMTGTNRCAVRVKTLDAKCANLPRRAEKPMKIGANELSDGNAPFYAFQCFGYGWYTRAFIGSNTEMPNERDFIKEYGSQNAGEYYISSGTMVGDEYWAYMSKIWAYGAMETPYALCTIDISTGEIKEEKARFNENEINCTYQEMSYDPSTGYIYAIKKLSTGDLGMTNTGVMDVIRIDPADPENQEVIGQIEYVFTMAVDNNVMYLVRSNFEKDENGDLVTNEEGYAIPANCSLLKVELGNIVMGEINPEEIGLIDNGKLKIDYYQTMEFDHTTHTLWWANQNKDGKGRLCKLDVGTALTSDSKELPQSSQYLALGIPYQTAQDNAPSHVCDLGYKVAEEGKATVTFTWNNPSLNYQLGRLEKIDGIKIYRDGTLLHTYAENLATGATATWTDDTGVTSAMHTYRFVPYNAAGDGLYKEKEMFVGRDIPGLVENLTVTPSGNKAVVSWDIPKEGLNKGWFDNTTVEYTVVRMPDNVTIADGVTVTTVSDEVDSYKGYYYQVVSSNADGTGATTVSKVTPFGVDVEIPYLNRLGEEEALALVTIDNNRDGTTWEFFNGSSLSQGCNNYNYSYSANVADDWLMLPPFKFENGKKYELRVVYATSTYMETEEKLAVTQGTSKEPGTHTAIQEFVFPSTEGGVAREFSTIIEEPSKGNSIGLHLYSEGDMGWIQIREIMVREYSATDLSVIKLSGTTRANVNIPSSYTVTIGNEGYAQVDNSKVQLFDAETNEVLAEAETGAVAGDAVKTVQVLWTPAEEGTVNVKAKVILDGDTYPDDNVGGNVIKVEVAGEDGERVLTIGEHEAVSWLPIYHKSGFSRNQIIYYANEIGLENIIFKGMEYTYSHNENTEELVVPVTVYMANTDIQAVPDNYDEAFDVEDGIYTKVFEGDINLSGTEDDAPATMMFDTEFEYENGKNILVKVETNGEQTARNVDWHVFLWGDSFEMTGPFRVWYHNNPDDNGYPSDCVPVTKFYYNSKSTGIENVLSIGINMTVVNNGMVFDTIHDCVEVFDSAGKMVAKARDTDKVTGIASGFYVVRITDDDHTVTVKGIVK